MKHFLFFFSFLSLTAVLISYSACVIRQPAYCKDFNKLSDAEKKEEVKRNSTETNFNLIRCSYYTEGGAPIADEPIIEGGASSVPFLLTKLEEGNDEDDQEMAISLLYRIDIQQKLQNRSKVITKIEQVVEKMRDESRKKRGLERIEDMKGHSSQ